MDELTLYIVGINHPNDDRSSRRFELLLCAPGDSMELRLEPKNKHDPRAIAVYSARGIQVGYVSAERAPLIGSRIRDGIPVAAVFQGLDVHVAYLRVRFGGGDPTLPPPSEVQAPRTAGEQSSPYDDDFFPDPEGPVWGA